MSSGTVKVKVNGTTLIQERRGVFISPSEASEPVNGYSILHSLWRMASATPDLLLPSLRNSNATAPLVGTHFPVPLQVEGWMRLNG